MSREPSFDDLARADREGVERRLDALVTALASQHEGMRDAVRYSLLGGGKRLRPLLCLWTHDLARGRLRDAALDAACAIECIHTYSLIHDDLPCMDDDDFRRGRPSSHRRFGEAIAVLAGDALLNLAYEIMSTLTRRHALTPDVALEATAVLAAAAGTGGLIAGQALDLAAVAGGDEALVDRIHTLKTARLVAAAMETGAIVAGAAPELRERVRAAGLDAGRAFQIADDLLDLEGDQESLGKTPRKDVERGKLTFPSVVGSERARRRARELAERSVAALPEARGTRLETMIRHLADRNA